MRRIIYVSLVSALTGTMSFAQEEGCAKLKSASEEIDSAASALRQAEYNKSNQKKQFEKTCGEGVVAQKRDSKACAEKTKNVESAKGSWNQANLAYQRAQANYTSIKMSIVKAKVACK
ncbi:MAG: hypothetical protein RJB66_308 [Pseudomonadota bacterium]